MTNRYLTAGQLRTAINAAEADVQRILMQLERDTGHRVETMYLQRVEITQMNDPYPRYTRCVMIELQLFDEWTGDAP